MKRKKALFTTATQLDYLIAQYFQNTEAAPTVIKKSSDKEKTEESRPIKPGNVVPTISGLSLYLGFNSKQAFDDYESTGKFSGRLKQARLRIEDYYEKKLHTQYTSGAIFALKSLGWNERPANKPDEVALSTTLKVEIVQAGPQLASSEQAVIL